MDEASVGTAFAEALAAKDHDRLRQILAPDVDFRGVTPGRSWEATDAEDLLGNVISVWFGDGVRIDELERVETDTFADRERVGYRLAVTDADGSCLVEQQAFLGTDAEGRIDWIRLACSGFRPVDAVQ